MYPVMIATGRRAWTAEHRRRLGRQWPAATREAGPAGVAGHARPHRAKVTGAPVPIRL